MKLRPIIHLAALLLTVALTHAGDVSFPPWDGKESVAEYAKRAHLEPTLTLDFGGGVKWEGVLIPAGSFVMGSPASETKMEKDLASETQHKVALTQPFYMGKLEVTQAQYQRVMGENPSATKGDDLPVHNVAWQNAQDFCDKLSQQLGREVQLPTEAQWEYACRAGTTTAYHSGDTIADLDKVGWYGGNSDRKLRPGGQKLANAWSLYDMHGNIREFTRDFYSPGPLEDATDPTGPKEGDSHVVRGGAYTANAAGSFNCRAAIRRPTEALVITGFRVLVTVNKP
jgi:formylglycine-generating enzyme required for sulfatase activity